MTPTRERRRQRIASWIVLLLGAAMMLAGLIYGMLAPDTYGTCAGVLVEIIGVGVLIPGLHLLIDHG
jgi:uncharacterized protein involved in exopolysaccharide biosynthesis